MDTVDGDMIYKLEDAPSWYLCILLGFQVYVVCTKAQILQDIKIAINREQ